MVGGFRASWSSSEVNPSPMDELGACFMAEEEDVVGEKKAWMELFLCELAILVQVS
jgi:hypothetical protein